MRAIVGNISGVFERSHARTRGRTVLTIGSAILIAGCCSSMMGRTYQPSVAKSEQCPANGPPGGVLSNGSQCNWFALTEKLCRYNADGRFLREESKVIGGCICGSTPWSHSHLLPVS